MWCLTVGYSWAIWRFVWLPDSLFSACLFEFRLPKKSHKFVTWTSENYTLVGLDCKEESRKCRLKISLQGSSWLSLCIWDFCQSTRTYTHTSCVTWVVWLERGKTTLALMLIGLDCKEESRKCRLKISLQGSSWFSLCIWDFCQSTRTYTHTSCMTWVVWLERGKSTLALMLIGLDCKEESRKCRLKISLQGSSWLFLCIWDFCQSTRTYTHTSCMTWVVWLERGKSTLALMLIGLDCKEESRKCRLKISLQGGSWLSLCIWDFCQSTHTYTHTSCVTWVVWLERGKTTLALMLIGLDCKEESRKCRLKISLQGSSWLSLCIWDFCQSTHTYTHTSCVTWVVWLERGKTALALMLIGLDCKEESRKCRLKISLQGCSWLSLCIWDFCQSTHTYI